MKTELSAGEWTLMNALWKGAPMTIAQLTGALKDGPGWSKHTIISMLSRLETKGAVRYESNGRAREYIPILKQDCAVRQETRHFLDQVCGGHLGVMFNAMMDARPLTQADLEELSAILEQAKEDNGHA